MATSRGLIPRVLVKRVGKNWYAIGLEHAVTAWSEDLATVFEKFHRALAAEMAYGMRRGEVGDNLLAGVRRAPRHIWDEYAAGVDGGTLPDITVVVDASAPGEEARRVQVEPPEVRVSATLPQAA